MSRLRENPKVTSEAIEFLKSLNLLQEEEGNVSLNLDLIEFLERTLEITDIVSTGRIGETARDTQRHYNTYETATSIADQRKLAKRIRKLTEIIISDLRATQQDLRRLLDHEFSFETSLHLKLQQLEVYQEKSGNFTEAVEVCDRMFEAQDNMRASSQPLLETPRKRLSKQIRFARKSAAAIAHKVLEYIHRAKEGKEYLSKLARICDLIESHEFESRSNLPEVINNGALARLYRANPLRTILPSDLNGDEALQTKMAEKAELMGLIDGVEEIPMMEDSDDGSTSKIYLPDVPGILVSFRKKHLGRDLFTFLFEESTNFPDNEDLVEHLLESFLMIVTSELSMDLYASPILGSRNEQGRSFRHLRVFAEQLEDSRPRELVNAPILIDQ